MYSKRAITQSVIVHLAIVLVVFVSVDFTSEALRRPAPRPAIVQARVIDPAQVAAEVERLKVAENEEKLARERELKEAERKASELEKKRQTEQDRIKELEAERKRLSKEREAAQKKAEADREAEVQARKKAATEDQQRADAAAKKAAEAEEKQRAEAAAKKAAEAEEKRRLDEAAKKAAAAKEADRKRIEQALQDELALEEAAAQADNDAREIDRFVAAIANRVRQSFTILPGLDGLSCILRITLIPGGEVVGVQIVKSSGNQTFDRQAETAVRKASPLPVPSDPRLFQQMRSISFVFDPQT